MSDDATAVTDDATTEDAPAVEEPTVEEAPEATAETTDDASASAEVEETAEAEEETAVAEAEAEEPVAEESDPEPEAAAVGAGLPDVRVARVYVCERGHRTTTLWGQPTECQARPVRTAPVCGLPLYHITELPEQVQKALNPLKASKKGAKK